jgi:hypothetical protein
MAARAADEERGCIGWKCDANCCLRDRGREGENGLTSSRRVPSG